jgi:hypothetical protein
VRGLPSRAAEQVMHRPHVQAGEDRGHDAQVVLIPTLEVPARQEPAPVGRNYGSGARPFLTKDTISPSSTVSFCMRYTGGDVLGKVGERREWVAIAGDQLSTAMLDDRQGTEAVVFNSNTQLGSSNRKASQPAGLSHQTVSVTLSIHWLNAVPLEPRSC